MDKKDPAGIKLLGYFYLLTAFSLIISFILGRNLTDVVCLGQRLSKGWTAVVMLTLMLVPIILFFGFRRPNKNIWHMAVGYHLFFSINSLLGLIFILNSKLPIKPIIRITGKDYLSASDIITTKESFNLFVVFNLNLLLGAFILLYLWEKRDYFFT